MRLIIATSNKGKFREIKKILTGLKIKIISLNNLGKNIKIVEDGNSFYENAVRKAMAVSKKYPFDLVAADDSGLEVEYLGGKPGIFSKRYSGKRATDFKNNQKLLKKLKGVKKPARKAKFHCAIALARNKMIINTFEGEITGYISDRPSGHGGFGYDPVFYLPYYKKTMAQIPLKKKNKISHRAKAFRKLKIYLAKYLKSN